MAKVEIVPAPGRDVDEDAASLVTELTAFEHDTYPKLEQDAHAGIAIAIRVIEDGDEPADLLERISQLLAVMRRRREARGAPRKVAAVYGPNGDVLLEVEI